LPPAVAKRNAFSVVRRIVYPKLRGAATCEAEWTAAKTCVGRVLLCPSLAALFFVTLWLPRSARTDQPSYDTVGAIEGEDVSVQGPLNIEVVQGRKRTILRSGSDVRVNSGQAQIELIEGGKIAICGPAHFSVLKSVNLLTLALNTGIIHALIEGPQPTLTVYTAQIQAKPFAIGDAPQDTLVGLDQAGAMCIRADSGAVRVEQQLTAQTIIVPQSGEVLLTNGQLDSLRSGVTHCSCELQVAKTPTARAPQSEVSRLPTSEETLEASRLASKAPEASPPPAKPAPAKPVAKEGPVYQVFMPPLSYDASAKIQRDDFDPQLIVLVRRVRVRPALIFQGNVKDAPAVAKTTASAAPPTAPPSQQAQQKNPQTNNSIFARIRAFFRSLFS
jgi:hypothetical protein